VQIAKRTFGFCLSLVNSFPFLSEKRLQCEMGWEEREREMRARSKFRMSM